MNRSTFLSSIVAYLVLLLLWCCVNRTYAQDATRPLDVIAKHHDINDYPLNPIWGYQDIQGSNTPLHDHYTEYVPGTQDNPNNWFRGPNPCTHIHPAIVTGRDCGPHVNLLPITYQGQITYTDVDWKDDDCDMLIQRQDQALYTTRNQSMYSEFSSDETFGAFTTTWWSDFLKKSDGDRKSVFTDKPVDAISIGLLGFDCPIDHSCQVEMHPVFILAMNVAATPLNNTWVFFARNFGNEGYCSADNDINKPGLVPKWVDASGRYIYKQVIPSFSGFDFDPTY